jgi:ribonuclease P protein component
VKRPALDRLKKRSDFLRLAKSPRKWAATGLVLQAAARPAEAKDVESPVRYGLTVSRRVGGAVVRNRARRRLRAAACAVLPEHAAPQHDFVLIGRPATLKRPYPALLDDLATALKRVGAWREGAGA